MTNKPPKIIYSKQLQNAKEKYNYFRFIYCQNSILL